MKIARTKSKMANWEELYDMCFTFCFIFQFLTNLINLVSSAWSFTWIVSDVLTCTFVCGIWNGDFVTFNCMHVQVNISYLKVYNSYDVLYRTFSVNSLATFRCSINVLSRSPARIKFKSTLWGNSGVFEMETSPGKI